MINTNPLQAIQILYKKLALFSDLGLPLIVGETDEDAPHQAEREYDAADSISPYAAITANAVSCHYYNA